MLEIFKVNFLIRFFSPSISIKIDLLTKFFKSIDSFNLILVKISTQFYAYILFFKIKIICEP
jgi:hypothetical protein